MMNDHEADETCSHDTRSVRSRSTSSLQRLTWSRMDASRCRAELNLAQTAILDLVRVDVEPVHSSNESFKSILLSCQKIGE